MKTVLLTGGLGFIGSHICVELIKKGYKTIIIDNCSNSSPVVADKIEQITGIKPIVIYSGVCYNVLDDLFNKYNIDTVIHLAGLKSVSESIADPITYYDNNINSTLELLKIMKKHKCYNLVFSSSATVYGHEESPITEMTEIGKGINSPYGETKFMIEKILMSLVRSDVNWRIVSLRYFNPVGAHESGIIGESPNDIPNNLMPFLLKVATNNNTDKNLGDNYNELKVFGNDYATPDGSCIRDFIHVVDLANAHISAIEFLNMMISDQNGESKVNNDYMFFNIGTGKGTTVLELIETFKRVNDVKLPYTIVGKREGDIPVLYCDNTYAVEALAWNPVKTIDDICKDSWNFQKSNC